MAVVVYVPSRLGEGFFTDLPAPGAGDDAKAITYDHDTGAFVYAAAGGGTPGGSTTQVQYNNAGAFAGDAGMTYDAANDRLTVTGGLVAPSMRPASDSTTALQWQTAAGTAFVYGDTTNQRVGLGQASPVGRLHITTQSIADNIICDSNGTAFVAIPGIQMRINGTIQGYWATATAPNIYFTNGVVTGDMIFRSESASVVFGRGTTAALWVGQYVAVGQSNSTALLDIAASSTVRASLRVRSGVAPTSPNDGDVWFDGNDYYLRGSVNSYSVGQVVRTTAIRPVVDGPTALQWQNAAGAAFVYGDTSNQRVGIGISAPFSILHIATTTTNPLRLGRLDNNTQKGAYVSSTQFDTAIEAEGWQLFGGFADTGEHRLMFGGGASALNSATNIRFYTGASVSTREGTERIRIQSDGKVGIGESTPTALLDIAASTTVRASLRIRSGVAPTSPNAGDVWFDGTHFYGYTGSATVQLDN